TFFLVTLNRYIGTNQDAWPSQTTLANAMNASPRAVRKWQSELEEIGVLQVAIGKGRSLTNRYRLNLGKLRRKEEPRAAFQSPSEVKEEPRASLMRNHVPLNQEPRAYRNIKKEQLKEQGGNHSISGASVVRKSKGKTDSELNQFCTEWNAWHSSGIVRQKIRDTESPGKTIFDAWVRSQRDPEQRERLKDFQSLRSAIEGSQQMLQPAGWFDAAGLIGGKNSNRRWYAEQLLSGVYRDRAGNRLSATPDAEQAWQAALVALQRHSHYCPDNIRNDLDEPVWQVLQSIGLKRVEEAKDLERNDLKVKFLQAFDRRKVAE
ncbi:MAG: helix-turn-helix domain-containing protein, partial [Planctomyces sp.]